MATNKELGLPPKGTYPAKVIEVIDNFKVVINRGKLNCIRIDTSHLVYSITNKPIYDPITSDFIGHVSIQLISLASRGKKAGL